MKKTMIALAAVAAVGAASAQVALTGGVDFGYIKNLSDNPTTGSKGLVNWGAYLDFTATEDLGGGMSVAAFMELNADSSRGATGSVYSGDRSLTLSMPAATLTFANTRSGGNQGAALVGPAALWDGTYAHGVITRSNIDVVALTVPVSGGFKVSGKYVESGPDYATAAGTATTVLGVSYSGSGLSVAANYNSSEFNVSGKAQLAAVGVTDPRSTSTDLSVVYDAGVAKVGFGYDSAAAAKQTALTRPQLCWA